MQYGDTLSDIARHYYQDGAYYPLIVMVSEGILDPDVIIPGMALIIPALNTNLNDSRARASIISSLIAGAAFEELRGRHDTALLMQDRAR